LPHPSPPPPPNPPYHTLPERRLNRIRRDSSLIARSLFCTPQLEVPLHFASHPLPLTAPFSPSSPAAARAGGLRAGRVRAERAPAALRPAAVRLPRDAGGPGPGGGRRRHAAAVARAAGDELAGALGGLLGAAAPPLASAPRCCLASHSQRRDAIQRCAKRDSKREGFRMRDRSRGRFATPADFPSL
jgi:hypothetical protein